MNKTVDATQSLMGLRVMKVMNMTGTRCYMAPGTAGHDLPKIGKQRACNDPDGYFAAGSL